MQQPFSVLDIIALSGFIGAWVVYAIVVEWTPHGRDGLNAKMDRYREDWMRRMLAREMRMVDMQIMGSLQNGTAFFASTSLLAVGGALTLLRATEELMPIVSALPFGLSATRELWEAKTIGLVAIFAYAVMAKWPSQKTPPDPVSADRVSNRTRVTAVSRAPASPPQSTRPRRPPARSLL